MGSAGLAPDPSEAFVWFSKAARGDHLMAWRRLAETGIVIREWKLNPETAELAHLPMVLWAIAIGFDTMGMVLMNALIGAGDTRRSMWISILSQWAFFLPLAYLVGPLLGYGLLGVWILNGIYRTGQALLCAYHWKKRAWVGIDI